MPRHFINFKMPLGDESRILLKIYGALIFHTFDYTDSLKPYNSAS